MVDLSSAFDLLDIDQNKDLELSEFKSGLTSLGITINQYNANLVFNAIGPDEHGTIDKESFDIWLNNTNNDDIIEGIRVKLINIIKNMLNNNNNNDNINDDLNNDRSVDELINHIENSKSFQNNNNIIIPNNDDDDEKTSNKTVKHKTSQSTSNSRTDSYSMSLSDKLGDMPLQFNNDGNKSNNNSRRASVLTEESAKNLNAEELEQMRTELTMGMMEIIKRNSITSPTPDHSLVMSNNNSNNNINTNNINGNAFKINTHNSGTNILGNHSVHASLQSVGLQESNVHQSTHIGGINTSIHSNHNYTNNNNNNNNDNENSLLKLFKWYVKPLKERNTLIKLWYHGSNIILSFIMTGIMLILFIFGIGTLILCGLGIISFYLMFEAARQFAEFESKYCLYFFEKNVFPKFSIYIPQSYSSGIYNKFKEYIKDTHMLKITVYYTFLKLPITFLLSGVTLLTFRYDIILYIHKI